MTPFGRFELLRLLSSGGAMEIFLARAKGPGDFEKLLVLKRTTLDRASDEALHARFLAEARLAARLDHPNVVQVFDFGAEAGQDYLTMEHVDGPSLRQLIDRCRATHTPMPVSIAVHLAAQVCDALAYVHGVTDVETGAPLGLVHRDLSPDSVLVTATGVAKLTDFGLTRESDATQTHSLAAQPAYVAPEALRSSPRFDARSDLFSMGVVLYEALTSRLPFEGATPKEVLAAITQAPGRRPSSLRRELPEALDTLVAQLLASDPAARPAGADAVREALDDFLAKQPPVTSEELASFVQEGARPEVTTRKIPGAFGTLPAAAQVVAPVAASQTLIDDEPPEPAVAPRADLREGSTALIPALLAPVETAKLPKRPPPPRGAEPKPADDRWMYAVLACAAVAAGLAGWVLLTPEPPPPAPVELPRPPVTTIVHIEPPPNPNAPSLGPEVNPAPTPRVAPLASETAARVAAAGSAGGGRSKQVALLPPAVAPRPPRKNEVLITATQNKQPARATLKVDGKEVGFTPYYLTRGAGEYEVTARLKDKVRRASVFVSPHQGGELNFKMDGADD